MVLEKGIFFYVYFTLVNLEVLETILLSVSITL